VHHECVFSELITVLYHNSVSHNITRQVKLDGFNTHCSALIAADNCQIWWKFVNNFKSYSKKSFGLLFVDKVQYTA